MEPHEELLQLAISQGIELNGIIPKRIPGKGVGLVATHTIKPRDVVLEVPTDRLRSLSTVPKSIARKLPSSISVHGLLAADLALDKTDKYSVWNALCPRPEDLKTMPMVWTPELQNLLPSQGRELLSKQLAKLRNDWSVVSTAFPDLDERNYRYAWMLVNTRTFYYMNAKRKSKDDHMCLLPVADLFNHSDEGCHVAFDTYGFTIAATQTYAQGDEVKICYGRHSGDFLLVEYGFVMDTNRWDEVVIDDVVLEKLNLRQRKTLEKEGWLGKYVLDRETVCHRTQVALRLLCCPAREWKKFVDGVDDGAASQAAVDKLLVDVLGRYRQHAEETVREVKQGSAFYCGEPEQRQVLVDRWNQVRILVDVHILRLEEALQLGDVVYLDTAFDREGA